MDIIFILFAALGVFIVWLVMIYNKLISLRENRENSFADIDVQLKQRYDLIPQLLNTVKGAKNFEESVLVKVTDARVGAIGAKTIDEKVKADNGVKAALAGFFAVAENYPEIKSNQNFLQFQTEISDIENKLAASRRFFNSSTKEYNVGIKTFPAILIAGMFGFKEEIFFEIDDREKLDKTPEIKL